MATNAMIVLVNNGEERGIFAPFDGATTVYSCAKALAKLPTEALRKMFEQLKSEGGGYLLFHDPSSWCEYGYVIDLDKLVLEVYDRYAKRRLPGDRYNGKLKLKKIFALSEVPASSETRTISIVWENSYKDLANLPLTDAQAKDFDAAIANVGIRFIRNIFNAIRKDYYALPESIPSDWYIIDTDEMDRIRQERFRRMFAGNSIW